MPSTIQSIADALDAARRTRAPIARVTIDHPTLDVPEAYRIQRELVRRRLAEGHEVVGYKMGLTSAQKMAQMGVDRPIYGVLFESGRVRSGGTISAQHHIQPMVEPEIAFVLSSALRGPRCEVNDVLAATAHVHAAIEVIDSRYAGYRFDLPSVIADNTSAARFVISPEGVPASAIDLTNLGVVLEKNRVAAATGVSAAVLGNPALSVAMLANMFAEEGLELPRGSLIMSGGITAAVPVKPGDGVTCRIESLPSVSVRFV